MLKKGTIYTKAQVKKLIGYNDCIELYEEDGKQKYNFMIWLDDSDELFCKDYYKTVGCDALNPKNEYTCYVYKLIIPNEILNKAIERRETRRQERRKRA